VALLESEKVAGFVVGDSIEPAAVEDADPLLAALDPRSVGLVR
jgi:hypothetical protein